VADELNRVLHTIPFDSVRPDDTHNYNKECFRATVLELCDQYSAEPDMTDEKITRYADQFAARWLRLLSHHCWTRVQRFIDVDKNFIELFQVQFEVTEIRRRCPRLTPISRSSEFSSHDVLLACILGETFIDLIANQFHTHCKLISIFTDFS
jgi:hypothetical protein